MTAVQTARQLETGAVLKRESYSAYRRTMLPPALVRELSRRRPWRPVLDLAAAWACIAAAWVAAAVADRWWVTALAVVVIGNRFYGLFIIGHDGFHRRVLKGTGANDLFCDLFVFAPIGAITRINNRNHLLHHQNLATDDDPDRHKHACFNKATRIQLIGYLALVGSIITNVRNVFTRSSTEVRQTERVETIPRARYTPRDFVLLAAWQAALIAGLTWAFGWWGYPVMWVLPVVVFTVGADNLRTFAEHSQVSSDAEADERRLVQNKPSWLERQFLSPHNMNFHAAHHLWPSIPYYNLAAADAALRQSPLAGAITWRGSYLGHAWRYFRALPLEECRPARAGA